MTEAIEVNGSSPSKAFLKNLGANPELCVSCNKKVYAAERLGTGELVYHKACFRCTHCKKPLTLGQYTVGNNQPYCKPHYLRVFKETGGRYDTPLKSSEQKSDASTAGSTPSVVRQRSTTNRPDVVRTPQATSPSGASSSFITYRSPSLTSANAESDSDGHVKRLTSFAATRALFENASFGTSSAGGTPSEKPVTPSAGYVREMRAKREATPQSPEIKTSPPVYSPSKENEPISVVTGYSVTDDKEKEQKTADEEVKQAEQEVEEREGREQNAVFDEINNEVHLDKEQPAASAAFHVDDNDSKLNDDDKSNAANADDHKYGDKEVEERDQNVVHAVDDLIEIHDDHLAKEQPPASVAVHFDDNAADAEAEDRKEVGERDQNVVHTVDDLIEIHDDHLAKEQPPASVAVHFDDNAADADAEDRKEVGEREQDVIHSNDDLVQNDDEDQPDKEQPLASDAFLIEVNTAGDNVADANDNKYSHKDNEDNDVTAQQQQQAQQQQDCSYYNDAV